MSALAVPLGDRVRSALDSIDAPGDGARVVVALSGGLDSCVLLHLLRFGLAGRFDLVAAHYDHALRAESAADAAWVRGLCRGWDVPLVAKRAAVAPVSEEEARGLRYAFLEEVRRARDAAAVLTAHHADDQAETVLFRVLRGTGIAGLAGIPPRREPALLRPLLDVWREELEAYAAGAGLRWRLDRSNEDVGYARNALRHVVIPEAERLVAAGARRSLVRLARLARAEEGAWEAALEALLPALAVERSEDGHEVSVDRAAVVALDATLRARVLRALAESVDASLDEQGTRLAVEFSSSGRSGRGLEIGHGVELRRRLGRLAFVRPSPTQADRPLSIRDARPGSGQARLGGRRIPVSWGCVEAGRHEWVVDLEVGDDGFPILVRGRAPGDRIRLASGSKKLKKLLLEARIPADRRRAVPVVLDARGEVLWVPGIARAVTTEGGALPTLRIGIG